jgi:tRNA U38,U39,U40 pseudouridine synthase TruA
LPRTTYSTGIFHPFVPSHNSRGGNCLKKSQQRETVTTMSSVTETKSCVCDGCQKDFPSKSAVFRHLVETNGACLPKEDHQQFVKYVVNKRVVKVIILFGYIPNEVSTGDDAASLILEVLKEIHDLDSIDCKINRSYGHISRSADILVQDPTATITELLATKHPPLLGPVSEWLDKVNAALSSHTDFKVVVLGRREIPGASKFNAEMDLSHRRVEYMLPVDFVMRKDDYFAKFPSFSDGSLGKRGRFMNLPAENRGPDPEALAYLYSLKKMMQEMTTKIVDVDETDASHLLEKEQASAKRAKARQHRNNNQKRREGFQEEDTKEDCKEKAKKPKIEKKGKQRLLRRKRYHNFTPSGMAHEYLASRRLDRFYHRATLRFDQDTGKLASTEVDEDRPFFLLSLSGDLFLQGQCNRVVGLYIAVARGVIGEDIVDCVFDDSYPHLVPTPPAPLFGLLAGEAYYDRWEGKLSAILTPRKCSHLSDGWNDEDTLSRVQAWQTYVRENSVNTWLKDGVDESGTLNSVKQWIEQVLEPWAVRAREQLEHYRSWKAANEKAVQDGKQAALLPLLQAVDSSVPVLFERVLHYLRLADSDGQWPSTTPKRQLVMVSTEEKKEGDGAQDAVTTSLSVAQAQIRRNEDTRASAYRFTEGQGGASGSFSVGAMPGSHEQPKANSVFPELMKAAFELEIALFPDREPSSTIAVNRNAQFRPHTDSGAGAGQSTSLIVGLGNYAGGELVVEGEQKDIRYQGLEFNGWKQRHWTMPFSGERYSLVWFTPKGCEGLRGIDLCK